MRVRWLAAGLIGVSGCQTLLAPVPADDAIVSVEGNPSPPRGGEQDGGIGSAPPSLPGKGVGGLGSSPDNPSPGPSPKKGGEEEQTTRLAPPSLLGKGAGGSGSSPDSPSPRKGGEPENTTPAELPPDSRPLPPDAWPGDPLTLAAECLQRGDQPTAATHLGSYVRLHPDQLMFRAQLAELLLRLDRRAEARAEFERFVADAQGATGPPHAHLVHCHTRLMEVGRRDGDPFADAFHRGVGLLLLAGEDAGDDGPGEEVLCQAIKALTEAKERRPADPRVYLYLADAHDRAGNRRAADVARAAARNLATPGALTPAEARRLSPGTGDR